MIARRPTDALRVVLDQLEGPYVLRVECEHFHCRGPLGRWTLDPGLGIAVVDDRPARPEDRSSAPRPFTAAAQAGKGYRRGPNTSDANGTYTATCKKCGRKKQLGEVFRTKLFFQALHDHQTVVLA